jgi:hypothetical protein
VSHPGEEIISVFPGGTPVLVVVLVEFNKKFWLL